LSEFEKRYFFIDVGVYKEIILKGIYTTKGMRILTAVSYIGIYLLVDFCDRVINMPVSEQKNFCEQINIMFLANQPATEKSTSFFFN
jgi:hypothetical protein